MSTVVIAVASLVINSSIQNAQVSSARSALEITKENNYAQRELREIELSSGLVDNLTSENVAKRRLAIVALKHTLPDATYQEYLAIILDNDANPLVRTTALIQASEIVRPNTSITTSVNRIAAASDSGELEAKLASRAVANFAAASLTDSRMFVMTAASPGEAVVDTPEGGFFTQALIKILSNRMPQGIKLSELSFELTTEVKIATGNRQTPVFTSSDGTGEYVIGSRDNDFSSFDVLIISNGNYQNTHPLQGSQKDGQSMEKFWISKGARVKIVTDGSKRTMELALREFSNKGSSNRTALFYYSGHAFSNSDGKYYIAPIDAHLENSDKASASSVATEEIKNILLQSKYKHRLIFIDSCF